MKLENYLETIKDYMTDLPEDLTDFGINEDELTCDMIVAYESNGFITLAFIYEDRIEEVTYLVPEYLPEEINEGILVTIVNCAGFTYNEDFNDYQLIKDDCECYISKQGSYFTFEKRDFEDNCNYKSAITMEIDNYYDFTEQIGNLLDRDIYPRIIHKPIELEIEEHEDMEYLNYLVDLFTDEEVFEMIEEEPIVKECALDPNSNNIMDAIEILEEYAKEKAFLYVMENSIDLRNI